MRAYVVAGLLVSSAALASLDLGAQSSSQDRPQRAPSGERASATAVMVDVVVRDGRGRPVVTLGADDFEIYEDGVRQALGAFRPPAAASLPARADVTATVPGAPVPTSAPVSYTHLTLPTILRV